MVFCKRKNLEKNEKVIKHEKLEHKMWIIKKIERKRHRQAF